MADIRADGFISLDQLLQYCPVANVQRPGLGNEERSGACTSDLGDDLCSEIEGPAPDGTAQITASETINSETSWQLIAMLRAQINKLTWQLETADAARRSERSDYQREHDRLLTIIEQLTMVDTVERALLLARAKVAERRSAELEEFVNLTLTQLHVLSGAMTLGSLFARKGRK